MLSPAEFIIGSPADATGFSLFLPFREHDHALLIACNGEERFVIALAEDRLFHGWEFRGGDRLKGILISAIRIELDELSAFDTETNYAPYGAVVREVDRLSLAVRVHDNHPISHQLLIPIATGLAPCRENHTAGFHKWKIVLGEGTDKRVLREFSVKPAEGPPR